MTSSDYLLRQFDLLGRVMGKILAKLPGLKEQGDLTEGIQGGMQTLKDELDLDIDSLLEMPADQVVQYLIDEKHFSEHNLEQLSDILLIAADNSLAESREGYRNRLNERIVAILEYLEESGSTFSLERHHMIIHLKSR